MNIKLDDTAVNLGTKAPAVNNAKVKKLEAKCAELRTQLKGVQPPVLGLNSFKPTSTDQCDVCTHLHESECPWEGTLCKWCFDRLLPVELTLE